MISGKFSRIYSFLTLVGCFQLLVITNANAQMNRATQANNITSNIYQNNTHAITGTTLQQVMLNQNSSYVNLLSDTNLLDVRIFSPYATYTPGMGVFYGDTLFLNLASAHGTWNRSQWYKVTSGGCVCSDYVQYGDTSTSIATHHYVNIATAPLIPWADTVGSTTGSKASILTKNSGWTTTGNYHLNSYTNYWGYLDTALGLQARVGNRCAIWIDTISEVRIGYKAGYKEIPLSNLRNTDVGYETDLLNTSGNRNAFFGYFSGASNISGSNNTGVGYASLNNLSSGGQNTGLGYQSLQSDNTGSMNIAIGDNTLHNNTSGSNNIAIGYMAGFRGVNYTNAIALGYQAAFKGSNTTVLGDSLTTDEYNYGNIHFTGALMPNYQAGTAGQALISQGASSSPQYLTIARASDTLGGSTKVLGTTNTQVLTNYSGWATTGNAGTTPGTNFIGTTDNEDLMFKRWDTLVLQLSGHKNAFNIAVGLGALSVNFNSISATGLNNIAIGRSALHQTGTGTYNIGLGYSAGGSNTTGISNIYIGTQAGASLENGANYNICLGYLTAGNVPLMGQASYNFLGGAGAGYNLNNGNRNIFIGDTAGFNIGNSGNNIAIGMGAGKNGTNYTNAQAYGYFTAFLGSNTAAMNDSLTLLAQSYGFFRIKQPQSGAGAGLILPIQQSSATSGTITSNGAQILEFTGSTSSTLQITEPSSPYTGQQFEIVTNQSSLSLSFTNSGNFYATPSTVTNVQSHSFIYDGTKWVMRY